MPLDRNKHVSFDVETASAVDRDYALQPFRLISGEAFVSSFATVRFVRCSPTSRVFNSPTRDQLLLFLRKCLEEDITIIGWNVAFDAAWTCAMGLEDLVLKVKWLDGMLLWKHLTVTPEYGMAKGKRKSYGLKAAVAEFYPGEAGYEAGIDFVDMSPQAVENRLVYNQKDAIFTYKLTEKFYNELEKEPQRLQAALIEAKCIPMVAASYVHGLNINVLQAERLKYLLEVEVETQLAALSEYGVTAPQLKSPAQLAKLLFEDWGLPILKRTAKGQPSTDKEVLHELLTSVSDPRAGSVRKFREAEGNLIKFAVGTLASVEYNGDGCTRPQAQIYSTYTGRMTFASKVGRGVKERPIGIPLHQMKGDKGDKLDREYRQMLVPPEGYSIVEFDAAGQEFRWMAIMSADTTMLQLCMPGEDAHSYMGSQIARREYRELMQLNHDGDKQAKNDRKLGKFANLSFQYRISAEKATVKARVEYKMSVQQPFIQGVKDVYLRSYPRVPVYWRDQIFKCERKGFAETLAGRRVDLRGDWRRNGWSLESTAINFPIQGVGADQKYLALAVLKPYLTQVGARFFFELHDGIYLLVPNAKVDQVAVEGKWLLDNLPYHKAWNFNSPIPLTWDCKTGDSWGNLKEYRYD